jgi:pimeloyl-ACP methyl ester carboxylesterase
VKDCEAIRKILLGGRPTEEDRKWTILGQSFGGFVSLTYLSFHPEGLKESFITGGLAPVALSDPEKVYQLCVREYLHRLGVWMFEGQSLNYLVHISKGCQKEQSVLQQVPC